MAAVDFRVRTVNWALRDVPAEAVGEVGKEGAREDELEMRKRAAGRKRRRPWPPPAGPAPKRRRVADVVYLTPELASSELGPASPPPVKCESRLESVEPPPLVFPVAAAESTDEVEVEEGAAAAALTEEVKVEEGAPADDVKIVEGVVEATSEVEVKVEEGPVAAASAEEVKVEEGAVAGASAAKEMVDEGEVRAPGTCRGKKQGPSRDRRSCHQCKRVKPSPERMIRCQRCDLRIYCAACVRNRQCL